MRTPPLSHSGNGSKRGSGRWRPGCTEKPVTLRTEFEDDVPDALIGDERLLRQVLANLLSNAIKFTKSGHVILRVRTETRDEDEVLLAFDVEDTGIGIPPEKQQVIFEEFVQADASTTRHYGGTGLGLAIAARLVDVLGGRIGLDSEPGVGSTFHFTARFVPSTSDDIAIDVADATGEAAALGTVPYPGRGGQRRQSGSGDRDASEGRAYRSCRQ